MSQLDSFLTPARVYQKGQGEAVADRTVNRVVDGRRETWADVALRVARGNVSLTAAAGADQEFHKMHRHLRQASILMSGRHLQHGDETQSTRPQEVFTNCSTSASSFIEFYLLLNGSGVGRSYDNDMMIVDWAGKMPHVVCKIRPDHPDVLTGEIGAEFVIPDIRGKAADGIIIYMVPDSREGWAKATEQIERLTWEGTNADKLLVLDFSGVRHRGAPIKGMQDRPASGPAPLMDAIKNMSTVRSNGMEPWLATMHVDHYLAECVLVGGARRAARMATKTWRDKNVLKFVSVKKGGVLWSSNNSVTVDEEFWKLVSAEVADLQNESDETFDLAVHAKYVFEAICKASYFDQTGEPGLINVDKLAQKDEGIEALMDGNYAESARMKPDPETLGMTAQLAKVFATKRYNMIVNPCGEIPLSMLGGYCVIGDVVPYHAGGNGVVGQDRFDDATWDDDAEDAFRVMTRALMRTNLMNCLYGKEVKRTNRIGVGMTGIHEYAWARFGLGWKDLVDARKSLPFWQMMSRFSNAVVDESIKYAAILGVAVPHTSTTFKPAGCATPDSTVKTTEGVMSLEQIFAASGHTLEQLETMPDGTWLAPTRPAQVLDENDEPKSVTKLYVNGIKPVYEIAFEDGHIVKLTGNHKLKTLTGWKRVDELTEQDEIVHF